MRHNLALHFLRNEQSNEDALTTLSRSLQTLAPPPLYKQAIFDQLMFSGMVIFGRF